MIDYKIEVYTLNNTTGIYSRIGEIETFTNPIINLVANKPHSAQFNLNIFSKDNKFILPFRNWILIKRNEAALFFGKINDVRGQQNSSDGDVTVTVYDVLYELTQRTIPGSYIRQNTDAGTIASELIALTQAEDNGNLGIQDGVINTVGDTNETLFYGSPGDAILNQSDNIIGYDFTFTTILDADGKVDYIKFDVSSSFGVVRKNLPPVEVGYSTNLITFAIRGEVYNKIYSLGQGTGNVVVTTSQNEGSKSAFGLREKVIKSNEIQAEATLRRNGDNELNESQSVIYEVAFELTQDQSPYFGQFGLFDTLLVEIELGHETYSFNGTAKIKELNITYDSNTGQENVRPIIKYSK